MNNNLMVAFSRQRSVFLGAGCLAAMFCGLFAIQADAAVEPENRVSVDQMQLISRQLTASAWRSVDANQAVFSDLALQVERFDEQKSELGSAQLAGELSLVDVAWQPVKRAAQTLVDAGPEIVFVHGIAQKVERNLGATQVQLTTVANTLRDQRYGSVTVGLANRNLWLNERISRSINRILAGESTSDNAAAELRADAAELLGNFEALTRGDAQAGVRKVADTGAVEALSAAFGMFSAVSASVDKIAASAGKLRQAAAARDLILSSGDTLGESVSSLSAAVDNLSGGDQSQSTETSPLVYVPGLIAIGLLVFQFLRQRRRAHDTQEGIKAVNGALRKISEGDLLVRVPDDSAVLAEIAKQVNSCTASQRALVQNILSPFDLSVAEISKIGVSAGSLVKKGEELTRSVDESITAATEMVRTSEEIKRSTAEAARTSDRNCQQVAQGYELTKDMSKASADVRESVQETSKSAKRQGELIQSVTAAAEYIQALNTKISVVAINTRIEAEKAGEYGRPFLGIAEAIADLLREAGEEGRKIISEVRMLQNMSAENLSSMENTVGTVVTILEYIERLDGSLEEINSGSDAISSIIRSVDDAAGQSAVSALHMNSSMAEIRERNQEIGKFSASTRSGVERLQLAMRDAAESLGQFRTESGGKQTVPTADLDALGRIGAAPRVYREEDMSALEAAEKARASV